MSKYRITLEGKTYEMEVELVAGNAAPQPAAKPAAQAPVSAPKAPAARPAEPSAPKQQTGGTGAVVAPMPGTVLRLEKTTGDAVRAGEVVLVLEAMKMENEILAPADGTIEKLNCEVGGTVAGGEVLFEVV